MIPLILIFNFKRIVRVVVWIAVDRKKGLHAVCKYSKILGEITVEIQAIRSNQKTFEVEIEYTNFMTGGSVSSTLWIWETKN